MYEKNMVKGYIALRNDVEKQNGMLHTTHLVSFKINFTTQSNKCVQN